MIAAASLSTLRLGDRAAHAPHALVEQLLRPVVGLGLHVLRQADGDGAGLGRIGQHPHRRQQRGDELLGALDAVPVAGDRAQRVVDRDVVGARVLEFLQHGAGRASGEDVAGQQQHGQPADRRERRAGDHVRRARADRRRARQRGQAVLHSRVAGRGVHHRLLVAGVVEGHRLGLLEQRLPDARDVAVTEDAETARDQPLLDAVALGVLDTQEPDQRLRHRQSHACLLADVIGSRGSISWSRQEARIQACAGSSTKFHARSVPAITLR